MSIVLPPILSPSSPASQEYTILFWICRTTWSTPGTIRNLPTVRNPTTIRPTIMRSLNTSPAHCSKSETYRRNVWQRISCAICFNSKCLLSYREWTPRYLTTYLAWRFVHSSRSAPLTLSSRLIGWSGRIARWVHKFRNIQFGSSDISANRNEMTEWFWGTWVLVTGGQYGNEARSARNLGNVLTLGLQRVIQYQKEVDSFPISRKMMVRFLFGASVRT